MLTALLPLLPLLQAVPLHIEAARNQITESLQKASSSSSSGIATISSNKTVSTDANSPKERRKRTFHSREPAPTLISTNKKRRLDQNVHDAQKSMSSKEHSTSFATSLANFFTPSNNRRGALHTRPEEFQYLHRRGAPSASSTIGRKPLFPFPVPRTPRRPLADLSIASNPQRNSTVSIISNALHRVPTVKVNTPHSKIPTPSTILSTNASAKYPPRLHRVPSLVPERPDTSTLGLEYPGVSGPATSNDASGMGSLLRRADYYAWSPSASRSASHVARPPFAPLSPRPNFSTDNAAYHPSATPRPSQSPLNNQPDERNTQPLLLAMYNTSTGSKAVVPQMTDPGSTTLTASASASPLTNLSHNVAPTNVALNSTVQSTLRQRRSPFVSHDVCLSCSSLADIQTL